MTEGGEVGMSGRKRRVLHVVESYGGGVADAVVSFVQSTPDFEHHLLYARRADAPIDDQMVAGFASAEVFDGGHLRRVLNVRQSVRRVRPDVVHAHSSFGGVYARMGVWRRSTAVAYTPHCFAFERRDTSRIAGFAYWAIEKVLSLNTTTVAACSPREAELATQLRRSMPVTYVPNVARVPEGHPRVQERPTGAVIAAAGRVTEQKDPATFAAIARALREHETLRFVWFGGGDDALVAELQDAGVTVTGWTSKHETLDRLRGADIYVHTAAWEGFPVGLLEAVAVDVPALVLDRPYSQGLEAEMIVSDVDDAVRRLRGLMDDPPQRAALLEAGRRSFERNTASVQGQALSTVYGNLVKEFHS